METILGTWDDFYLEISTIVARTAQNMLVKIDELISNQVVNIVNILNNLNKNSSYYYIPDDAKNTLQDLQKSLKQIYDTYTIILKFKLQKSLRETATRNRKISREFINNLNSFTSGLTIYADSFDDVSAHLAPQDRKSSKPPKSKPHSEVGNSDNQTAKSKESNSGYSLTAALAGLGVIGLLIWWFTGSSANNSDAVEVGSTAVEISHDLVLVPGGSFMMGCTAEQKQYCESAEKPAHKVTLDSFYISKYEVTQLQWEKVMGSNPSSNVGCNSCPVENVSWEDVQAFIDRLNAALPDSLKKTGVYRLPTEAEWEYAARGGATATSPKEARGKNKSLNNSFVYAGGNNIEDVAWYSSNSNSTHPVGQKQPNKLGLYDMSGNVWEWCGDGYGDYQSNPQANPRGAASGSYRVLRGGSWTNGAVNCRVAYRHDNTPTYRYINYGFRVVLVP
ncbi:formylglycine-generating enzyme family protein [Sphingobacteriales bacterium UPWRP_1]|nr:hypothetical protein BVG80_07380 [Sphingobacteriales bacterium TSM_CSM]PSJ78260.1 formylglycine-generating enzyme family protein [Sphingobacteriales bacterium UPWRP_1]